MRTHIVIDPTLPDAAMRAGPMTSRSSCPTCCRLSAAAHDCAMRAAGFTVRKGIDVLIAAFGIERSAGPAALTGARP